MNQHFIALEKGTEIVGEIKEICMRKGIKSAYVSAIGAVSSAGIGFYDYGKKTYDVIKFDRALELTNLTGNVSLVDGEVFLHAHATFSDDKGNAKGGHLMSATVFPTCEVFYLPPGKADCKKV